MLFDLQSPRRRAAVKVIYATLAVLLGGGLVLFGIGGDAAGGLLDALGLRDQSRNASSVYEQELEQANKKVAANPKDEAALLTLVTLNIQDGNQKLEPTKSGQSVATPEAEDAYNAAADAWDEYLALKPKKPDTGAAVQLAQAFFLMAQSSSTATDAQVDLDNAADAQGVAARNEGSVGVLSNYALYLYYAGRFSEADAALAKAVAKTPASDRKQVERQFAAIEKQARAFQKQVAAEAKGSAGSQGTNPLGGSALSP